MFCVSSNPLALSDARINPNAALRCASVGSAKQTPCRAVVDWVHGPGKLYRRERGDEPLCRVPYRFSGNPRGFDLKKSPKNFTVGSDSLKWSESVTLVLFRNFAIKLRSLGGSLRTLLAEYTGRQKRG